MKIILPVIIAILLFACSTRAAFAFQPDPKPAVELPYASAGLTKEQAAAHILSRFSFGATPGQVSQLAETGIWNWFASQLSAGSPDLSLQQSLTAYPSLQMTSTQIVRLYPGNGQLLRMATRNGIIDRDSSMAEKKETRQKILSYMRDKGLRRRAELLKDLVSQKIIRAAGSENQLEEVLTDFWFNHFNVAVSKGGVTPFLVAYERDAIRPNALGNFEDLLLATAKSPAMLVYLDNATSSVNRAHLQLQQQKRMDYADSVFRKNTKGKVKRPTLRGLNENYAREMMELHTLGVDGGYTQNDVTEAARVLTGWGIRPKLPNFPDAFNWNKKIQPLQADSSGDVFLFSAYRHDREKKKVLGMDFPANGGYEEGLKLIHLLATHPSTARFICEKLAVRFVSDNPPRSLIDKMSKTFLDKGGNIREVLVTMVSAPEFWSRDALREKTKSPFELAITAVRNTGSVVDDPIQLYRWIKKMGQPLYNYQAPTGFPDKGQYWINTGSLLNRMNFGLALVSGRIRGINVNLLKLNNNHEPESADAALKLYAALLMPGRNTDQTIKRLSPLVNDPALGKKLENAAGTIDKDEEDSVIPAVSGKNMLNQVVGIIIGSPEYQRR